MSDIFSIPVMTKKVKLNNLVPDSSFEDVSNNWNVWLAEPTDTSQFKDGTRSLKLGGDALAATQRAIPVVAGHKYYGREYIKTAGQLDAADCRFELNGGTATGEHALVFGWNRGNFPEWTAISDVIYVDSTPASSYGLRTFTVGGSVNAWVDSIVLIDLTEACGAGNEPSKEWCDANIPFFSDSYTLDIPVSSPIQMMVEGLIIPEGVVTQITDASGRVLWSVKTFSPYIRPTGEVTNTLASAFKVYPAGSLAYTCISEEVADGDATYIYTTAWSDLTLIFSANLPTDKKISRVNLVEVGRRESESDRKAGLVVKADEFVFDGVNYGTKSPESIDGTGVGHTSVEYTMISVPILGTYYDGGTWMVDAQKTTEFAVALNEHVKNHGGEFSIEIPFMAAGTETKNDLIITQVYLEVIFEE